MGTGHICSLSCFFVPVSHHLTLYTIQRPLSPSHSLHYTEATLTLSLFTLYRGHSSFLSLTPSLFTLYRGHSHPLTLDTRQRPLFIPFSHPLTLYTIQRPLSPFQPLHYTEATLPSGWKMQSASNEGISGACATRVCTETEVCVRVTPPPANGHQCVSFPADCGSPAVTDGSLEWNGTMQGDVATLTCDSGYHLAPGSSSQLTCHVTARWTPLQVTCIRVIYSSVSFS